MSAQAGLATLKGKRPWPCYTCPSPMTNPVHLYYELLLSHWCVCVILDTKSWFQKWNMEQETCRTMNEKLLPRVSFGFLMLGPKNRPLLYTCYLSSNKSGHEEALV